MLAELEFFDPARTAVRQEIRADLARRAERRQRAQQLGDVYATTDLELAAELEELGFNHERACVVDLLPLIQVAWADGKIQREERARIVGVLRARGLGPMHPAWEFVEALLEQKPSDAYFEATLEVLARLLAKRTATAQTVVTMCVQVAEASGGLWGLRRSVDASEQAELERVAKALGEEAVAQLRRRLSQL